MAKKGSFPANAMRRGEIYWVDIPNAIGHELMKGKCIDWNETAVQAALSGLIKDKTVLIIAHRMRTVMNADQIVLLSGGRVVEMGSPAELLKKNGLFRHMAQLQSESMEWTA